MIGVNIALGLALFVLLIGVIGERDEKIHGHITAAFICVALLTIALNLIFK